MLRGKIAIAVVVASVKVEKLDMPTDVGVGFWSACTVIYEASAADATIRVRRNKRMTEVCRGVGGLSKGNITGWCVRTVGIFRAVWGG